MNYGLVRITPAVKRIILVTSLVFVLQKATLWLSGTAYLEAIFSLLFHPSRTPYGWWQIWRPLTYMFLHYDFWHLLWNMVGLFFLGAALEESIGSGRLLRLYLLSGIGGGLCALIGAQFGLGGDFLMGASAGALGVTFAFITLFPQETIMLWLLVLIPVKALYLGIILLLVQVFSMGGNGGSTSYLAHLGGIAVGVFMAYKGCYADAISLDKLAAIWHGWHKRWQRKHLRSVPTPASALDNPQQAIEHLLGSLSDSPEKLKPQTNHSHSPLSLVNAKPKSAEEKALDDILDKISREGKKALTAEEQNLLAKLSTRPSSKR